MQGRFTHIAERQTRPLRDSRGGKDINIGPVSTTGPLTNDQGLPAWFIAGSGQSSQYVYAAPGLTVTQQADIASQGFTLTLVARVLQNGLAPTYTTSVPVGIGGALVSYAGVRWEIDLGLNSNGDTVVGLPNTITVGSGGTIEGNGATYTLTGSGSTYHTYQLFYNPTTHVADLSVDGVTRLTGYTGETSYYFDSALAFGAASGGQGNFNFVQVQPTLTLTPTPTPSPTPTPVVGTLTVLTVEPRSTKLGRPVTLTASVRNLSHVRRTPTGSVTFLDGTTILRSVALRHGKATLKTPYLPVGQDSVQAVYGGGPGFASSTSATVIETVRAGPSRAKVIASIDHTHAAQAVNLTATPDQSRAGTSISPGTGMTQDGATSWGMVPLTDDRETSVAANLREHHDRSLPRNHAGSLPDRDGERTNYLPPSESASANGRTNSTAVASSPPS